MVPSRPRVYVSVSDTGCGMSVEDQGKLFKDFCTLKSNAHLNPNGVGLGLSICKKICTNLDGDIEVDSKIGTGTSFTFFVPCDLIDEHSGAIRTTIATTDAGTLVRAA